MNNKLLFFVFLILLTCSCSFVSKPKATNTILLNSIDLKISFNLPQNFDTSFTSVYFSDYDCQSTNSYCFANRNNNSVYMDTSSFLSTLDDSLNIEFDLLKISEETNTICAHKNYQEFKKYVLQINGLSNFDSSEYHEYIVTTENNGWSAIQLYGKKSFRSEKVWFMNSFVFFDNVYFQIDITDSKKDLQTLKKETEEIFRHLLIEKTT